jgi:hypothetical protein
MDYEICKEMYSILVDIVNKESQYLYFYDAGTMICTKCGAETEPVSRGPNIYPEMIHNKDCAAESLCNKVIELGGLLNGI